MRNTMETNDTDLARRLDVLEAHRAIERLVAEYCHGIDRREIERFVAIWHDDALYALGPRIGDVRGREQIRRAATSRLWPQTKATHHWTVNLSLEVAAQDDRATGLCNALVVGRDVENRRFSAMLTYEDVFTRVDGCWGFAERRLTLHEVLVPGLVAAP
jgi:hypothetical protein